MNYQGLCSILEYQYFKDFLERHKEMKEDDAYFLAFPRKWEMIQDYNWKIYLLTRSIQNHKDIDEAVFEKHYEHFTPISTKKN